MRTVVTSGADQRPLESMVTLAFTGDGGTAMGGAQVEGAATNADLATVADEMVAQRRGTATWIVSAVASRAPLRDEVSLAIDSLWTLMDPALFQRLVRWLGWSLEEYQDWFGRAAERLLVSDPHASTTPDRPDEGP